MPTFTSFDGLGIRLGIEHGMLVVRLLVPRGAGLPEQVLSTDRLPIDLILNSGTKYWNQP